MRVQEVVSILPAVDPAGRRSSSGGGRAMLQLSLLPPISAGTAVRWWGVLKDSIRRNRGVLPLFVLVPITIHISPHTSSHLSGCASSLSLSLSLSFFAFSFVRCHLVLLLLSLCFFFLF